MNDIDNDIYDIVRKKCYDFLKNGNFTFKDLDFLSGQKDAESAYKDLLAQVLIDNWKNQDFHLNFFKIFVYLSLSDQFKLLSYILFKRQDLDESFVDHWLLLLEEALNLVYEKNNFSPYIKHIRKLILSDEDDDFAYENLQECYTLKTPKQSITLKALENVEKPKIERNISHLADLVFTGEPKDITEATINYLLTNERFFNAASSAIYSRFLLNILDDVDDNEVARLTRFILYFNARLKNEKENKVIPFFKGLFNFLTVENEKNFLTKEIKNSINKFLSAFNFSETDRNFIKSQLQIEIKPDQEIERETKPFVLNPKFKKIIEDYLTGKTKYKFHEDFLRHKNTPVFIKQFIESVFTLFPLENYFEDSSELDFAFEALGRIFVNIDLDKRKNFFMFLHDYVNNYSTIASIPYKKQDQYRKLFLKEINYFFKPLENNDESDLTPQMLTNYKSLLSFYLDPTGELFNIKL